MKGKAKVTVHVDGKEPQEFEGDCVFCVVTKAEDDGVATHGTICASATAEVIGRAIAELERIIDEVKREDFDIAFKALEWNLQLLSKRCDELIEECDEILGGDDDE